eukprot:11385843-Alexandrium_andersonii.AAC.1
MQGQGGSSTPRAAAFVVLAEIAVNTHAFAGAAAFPLARDRLASVGVEYPSNNSAELFALLLAI